MEDALIVEETVIVPNVPVLEESIVVCDTPVIDENIEVPAVVQEPNEVEEVIDPAWREYVYNVEDKFVNVIITEYPMYPPILNIARS